MAQKKNPNLKLAEPLDLEAVKRKARKYRKQIAKKGTVYLILGAMMIGGTLLLWKNQSYTDYYRVSTYTKETSDSNNYREFGKGIIRYNRDGIVFLNRKNEELWIQPAQIQNPVMDAAEDAFAIADVGGNQILVFTEDGLKGEIETTLPIEKISVSNQGIVSAILKNETSPMILTYDATGNILVEHQITLGTMGYPTSLDLSGDGTLLAVSYLSVWEGTLKSKVAYYQFGDAGAEQVDHQVMLEEYSDKVIPEVFFLNDSRSVAVTENSFTIYQGSTVPEKQVEVEIGQEIKSTFHTNRHIGFILLNEDKSGYEVRLYNASGRQVMNREFTGEYSHVKMDGDEVIMYEGSQCCIINSQGVQRFKGDLKVNVLEMIHSGFLNRYYVISANEMRVIYLAK